MVYNQVINYTDHQYSKALNYSKYRCPQILEKEKELTFSKSWQLVGHISQVHEATL